MGLGEQWGPTIAKTATRWSNKCKIYIPHSRQFYISFDIMVEFRDLMSTDGLIELLTDARDLIQKSADLIPRRINARLDTSSDRNVIQPERSGIRVHAQFTVTTREDDAVDVILEDGLFDRDFQVEVEDDR